jgi:hypothetical protein
MAENKQSKDAYAYEITQSLLENRIVNDLEAAQICHYLMS